MSESKSNGGDTGDKPTGPPGSLNGTLAAKIWDPVPTSLKVEPFGAISQFQAIDEDGQSAQNPLHGDDSQVPFSTPLTSSSSHFPDFLGTLGKVKPQRCRNPSPSTPYALPTTGISTSSSIGAQVGENSTVGHTADGAQVVGFCRVCGGVGAKMAPNCTNIFDDASASDFAYLVFSGPGY